MRKRAECKVDNCFKISHAKGYCNTHYRQFKKHGVVCGRTHYTQNKIITEGAITKIILYDIKCKAVAETIIDSKDVNRVSKYKWSLLDSHKYIYVYNSNVGLLHHLILGSPPKGYEVDHKSRDTLDNRKQNLRFATRGQNNANSYQVMKSGKPTSSIYKGVYRDKSRNKWCVEITMNRKKIYRKRFDSENDAAKQYDVEAIKLFGEFALTNQMLGLL